MAAESVNGSANGGRQGPGPTVLQLRAFSTFLDSIGVQPSRSDLSELWTSTFGGKRDFFKVFGYKRTLRYPHYRSRYERDSIAGRIVDVPPQYTWRTPPTIVGPESFVNAWEEFAAEQHVYSRLEKLDRLSGLGRYGIMLIGAKGGGFTLSTPLPRMRKAADVLYLSVYTEGSSEIFKLEDSPSDPRFGLPFSYRVDLTRGLRNESGQPLKQAKVLSQPLVEVHWSRVIHAAETLDEDEIFGVPRLRRVWNLLDDLNKCVGGSGESFWNSADRGIQLDVDPNMRWNEKDRADLEKQADEWTHEWRRMFRTRGVKINTIDSRVVNPRGVFTVISSMVVGCTGIPLRILFGPERGQFSLPEERAGFLQLINDRQKGYAEPVILRPFIDRLIDHGALPNPRGGYSIEWEDLLLPSELEQSQVALNFSTATVNFAKQSMVGKEQITVEEARKFFPADKVSETMPKLDDKPKIVAPKAPFGSPPATPPGGNSHASTT